MAGPEKSTQLIGRARAAGRNLLEHEALQLLQAYGIPVLPFEFLPSAEAVSTVGLSYPLVVKAVSPQIVHKSEVGAVRLDVRNEGELAAAIAQMARDIARRAPRAVVEGWLLSPYLPDATEIIAGSIVDAQFGPAVMAGAGGIFTEAYRDVAFRLVPLSLADAEEMIDELQGQALLDGLRGRSPVSRDRLAALLVRLGTLVHENPDVVECDLNPILCHGSALYVVDARMRIRGEDR